MNQATKTTSQTGLSGTIKPVLNIEVSDDEEEFQDSLDELMVTSNRPHPFGGPRPLDPSSQLANTMGLNSERMQLMKASFFDTEQMETDQQHPIGGIHGDGVKKPIFKPQIFKGTLEHPVLKPKTRLTTDIFPRPQMASDNQSFGVDHPVTIQHAHHRTIVSKPLYSQTNVTQLKTHSNTVPLTQPQSLIPKRTLNYIVPSEKSWTTSRNKLFKDAGHFNSRSFRVGWGSNWTFVHSGHQVALKAIQVTRPQGIFNPLLPKDIADNTKGNDGLRIRAVNEKVDASPWIKLAEEDKKKVGVVIYNY